MLKFVNIQINKEEKNISLQVAPESLPKVITSRIIGIDNNYTERFYIDVSYTIYLNNVTNRFDVICAIDDHCAPDSTVPIKCQLAYEPSFSQDGKTKILCPYVIDKENAERIKNKCKNLLLNLLQQKENDGLKVEHIILCNDTGMMYCQISEQSIPEYLVWLYKSKYDTYSGLFEVRVKFNTDLGCMHIVSDALNDNRKLTYIHRMRCNNIIYNEKMYCDYYMSEGDISNIMTACSNKLLETGCIRLSDSQPKGVDTDLTSDLQKEMYKRKYENTNHNVSVAEYLNNNTPDGMIRDADTILEDIIENRDKEVSGVANDVFKIYRNASDKKSVKAIFEAITGTTFDDYVNECVKNTTRKQE